MEKLKLTIETVEDRSAPVIFTERDLPGFCCCSCCCCITIGGDGGNTTTGTNESLGKVM